MDYNIDILIIGAGPAASAAAITLRNHAPQYSCLLIEKSDFQEDRIGESLSPMANRFLQQLEVSERILQDNHLRTHATMACWGQAEPLHNEFIAHLHGYGWRLQRNKFDYDLAKAAEEKGAQLLLNCTYTRHEKIDNHWNVFCKTQQADHETEIQIHAKYIIDASGRKGVFAKKEGAKKQIFDRLLGIYAWYHPQDGQDNNAVPLVEAQENGWWYSAILPDKRWITAWMTDSDLSKDTNWTDAKTYVNHLAKATHTSARLGTSPLPYQIQIFPASTYMLDKMGGDGWISTGDTTYTYDPLSSSGILKALRTGIFSGYVALDFFKGEEQAGLEKYNRFIQSDFESYLATRKKYYSDEKRWSTAEFWLRRRN